MNDTTTQAPERPPLEEWVRDADRSPHDVAFLDGVGNVARYALWLEEENRRLRERMDEADEWRGIAMPEGTGLKLEDWKSGVATLGPTTPVRIYSGEHRLWWKPEGRGYTAALGQAGVFDFAAAITRTQHCGPEKRIVYYPVDSNA